MAIESLRDVARAGVSAFAGGGGGDHFGNTAPADPAATPNWYLLTGEYFKWDGSAWFQPIGAKGDPGDDGAAATIAKTTVSVVPAQFGQAAVSVAVVGALPTQSVLCQLVPNAEWDADDLTGLSVVGEAGTDTITFTISGPGPIVGAFAIAYQIG